MSDERKPIVVGARWVAVTDERRPCLTCGHTHSGRQLFVEGWSHATIAPQWHFCDVEGCPCTNLRPAAVSP